MYNKSKFLATTALPAIMVVLFFSGCSTQTDALPNRLYHQLNTKYNGFFYANQYLKEGVSKLENSHIDNYANIITINKYGDLKSAQAAQSSFDRAIEKSTLAIQKHSMDIDGEEKNKLVDKNYMVIGKSQFYKQEYLPAINTFNYILRKSSNEKIKTEALIWSTRCHQQLKNTESLNQNIMLLEEDYYLNKEQDALLDEIQAETAILGEYYLEAKQNLLKVLDKTSNKEKKIRVHYVLGQIGLLLKDADLALKHFDAVIKKNPEYEMVFNAKLNKTKTYNIDKTNYIELSAILKNMLKDSKNKEYLDQIYFTLSQMQLSKKDTIAAIQSLKNSAEKTIYNNNQKRESHYLLAQILWEKKDYVGAYFHCDTAYQLSDAKTKQYFEIKNMLRGARKIATHYKIIHQNDSIINISRLPEEEKIAFIDNYIEDLKEKEKQEKTKNETRGSGQPFNSYEFNKQAQNNMNITSSGGWYFYNPSAMSLGYSEFLSRWGNRKLEDNWRRKNKNQVLSEEDMLADSLLVGPTEKEKYNREYYLKQLPTNEEEEQVFLLKIETSYYDLATVFKEDLEDYLEAGRFYQELLTRFPQTEYRQLVYFDLYSVYVFLGDTLSAIEYLNQIKQEYPESTYLSILSGEAPIDQDQQKHEQVYKKAYDTYMRGGADACDELTKIFKSNEENPFILEIELLKVFCEAKGGSKKTFIQQLEMVRNKDLKKTISTNIDTIILTLRGEIEADPTKTYQNEPQSKHYFLLLIKDIELNLPETQGAISKFNNINYKLDSLAITNSLLTRQIQLLKVSEFENKEFAQAYYDLLQEKEFTKELFVNQKTIPLIISENNYVKLLKKQEINEYIEFFNEIYLLN